MIAHEAIRYETSAPIHVVRRNIAIGTAMTMRSRQASNLLCEDSFCVCYHLMGQGIYRDENTGKTYPFNPGSLRLRPPNMRLTKTSFTGKHMDKFITIPNACYLLLKNMNLATPVFPVVELGIRSDIIELHDLLTRRVRETAELALPRVVSEAFTFIVDVLLPRPAVNQKWRAAMEEAARILQSDYQEKVVIPDLARHLHMSVSHLYRLFILFFDQSPKTYRTYKKLEAIKGILLTEDVLIKEVAQQFGYADVYSFSRQFKKYTGLAPTTFRHSHN